MGINWGYVLNTFIVPRMNNKYFLLCRIMYCATVVENAIVLLRMALQSKLARSAVPIVPVRKIKEVTDVAKFCVGGIFE